MAHRIAEKVTIPYDNDDDDNDDDDTDRARLFAINAGEYPTRISEEVTNAADCPA